MLGVMIQQYGQWTHGGETNGPSNNYTSYLKKLLDTEKYFCTIL